jgi:hypothetical protein
MEHLTMCGNIRLFTYDCAPAPARETRFMFSIDEAILALSPEMKSCLNARLEQERFELSREERYTAYIILLREAEHKFFENNFFGGLCSLANKTFGFSDCVSFGIDNQLPELAALLDENSFCTWQFVHAFPQTASGWLQRIYLLKEAIELTK